MIKREIFIRFVALLVLSITLLLVPIWFYGAVDKDEPKYLESAKVMLETGDYITPRFNCKPRPDKPILVYWLILAGYRLFGTSPGSGRFFVALSGVLTVLALFLWLLKIFSPDVAFWGALALLSNFEFILMNSVAMPDAVLLLFITLAVVCFYEERYFWGTLFSAFAFLTKGPVGVVLPLLVARPRKAFSWSNLLIFLLVVTPWYVAVILKQGISFAVEFFFVHNLIRFTKGISGHSSQWWYYLVNSLWIFFPITPWVPSLLYRGFKDKGEARFCAYWVLVVLVFFQIARTKLPHYILPALPPLSALAGIYLHQNRWYIKTTLAFLSLVFVLKFLIVPLWDLARRDLDAARLVSALALESSGKVYFYKYYSPAMILNTGLCIDRLGKEQLLKMADRSEDAIIIANWKRASKLSFSGNVLFIYRPLLMESPVAIIKLKNTGLQGESHAEAGVWMRSGTGTESAGVQSDRGG